MSTRAVIAYTKGDGRWKGVFHHWNGHTQWLGRALIERVAIMEGDLDQLVRRVIDHCPEGWSNLAEGERMLDPAGVWAGRVARDRVTFETGTWDYRGEPKRVVRQLPDAHYLYLIDLPTRRLLVYEVNDGPCEAFTQTVFDAAGASQLSLLPVPE